VASGFRQSAIAALRASNGHVADGTFFLECHVPDIEGELKDSANCKVLVKRIANRDSLAVKSCVLGTSGFPVDLIGGSCQAAFGSQGNRLSFG